jgi:mannosyltransferase OCH1-like enzyme
MKIPKIILQTNCTYPEKYLIKKINNYFPEWNYQFYKDIDIIKFFMENPLDEFPNIIEKFVYMPTGAHRADLFRYYFLYLKGGVFMDSDAMLTKNINEIIHPDTDFFTVNSRAIPNSIFQGFIGTTPKNPILYDALKQTYNTQLEDIKKDYHLFCKQLYQILEKEFEKSEIQNIQIFYENEFNCNTYCYDIHNTENIILKHYAGTKVIPINL